jgi:hypothetical protein
VRCCQTDWTDYCICIGNFWSSYYNEGTPWNKFHREKLIIDRIVQKFQDFNNRRKFIIVSAPCHLIQSCSNSFHFTPRFLVTWTSITLPPYSYVYSFKVTYFLQFFLFKFICISHLYNACYMSRQFIFLD